VVSDILGTIGLGPNRPSSSPEFVRSDGSIGKVEHEAEILQVEPLPDDAFLITQISRWDVLKDHEGLLRCFSDYLGDTDVHLALVGPSSAGVADDPEGPAVGYRIFSAWKELPDYLRRRVHIVNLPMDDFDENGVMVNAIQRRADIVVQKSLVEGFGLTVSEAMWKGKPVVASAVGGIQDQIVDGVSGILIEDPTDLNAFAQACGKLITDPELAEAMGEAARERVKQRFLVIPRLRDYARVILSADAALAARGSAPEASGG
jgi:trehalose synthase